MVCDASNSCFAILWSRFRTRAEAPLFFRSYVFSFSYFSCTRQFSAFNSFIFLNISNVKIVKLAPLSTLIIVYFGRALRGRRLDHAMLADSCESLKMRCDTSRPMGILIWAWHLTHKDAPLLHNKIVSFLWAVKKAKNKEHHLMCSYKNEYTDIIENWTQKCLKYLPQNFLLRRLNPVHVAAE